MIPPLPGPEERSPIAADFLARWQARLLVSQRRRGLQGAEGTRTDLELAPHQARTVLEVLSAPRVRHVLADEVGMGKTIEALMVYQALRVERPRLWTMILVPGHLSFQWLGEIYLRAHRVFALATGERPGGPEATNPNPPANPLDPEVAQDLLVDREWIASSEDARQKLLEGFGGRANAQRPRLLVVDEAHRLAPEVYALVQALARKVEHVLLLTATPVELESQGGADQLRYEQLLRILDPDLADEEFAKLRAREASVVGRFEGTDDQKDLAAASGLAAWRVLRHRRADAPRVFRKRVFHRHVIAPTPEDPKLPYLKDLIARAWREDRQAGKKTLRKFLVFVARREILERVAKFLEEELATDVAVFHEGLDNTLRMDGEPPPRLQQLLDFRGKASTAILVCEDLAAEGHNLHSTCHTVVLYDLPANPNTTEQRIGRVDRLGQSRDVIVHALVIEGTDEVARLERQASLGVFERSIGALTPSEEEALARGEALGVRRDLTSPLRAFRNRRSEALDGRIRATLEAPEGWVFRTSARFQDWYGEASLAQHCLGSLLTRAVLRAFDLKAEKNEDPPPRVRESLRFRLARGDQPIPGYRDIWGTLDRDEALEQDHLQFFASGHPFVEDVLARALGSGQRQALRFRIPGQSPMQGVLAHFVWDPASAVEGSFAQRLARVALPVLSVPVVVARPTVGLVVEAGPPSREKPSLLRSLLEALAELDPTACESLLADPYVEEQAAVWCEQARAAALENVRARLGDFPDELGRRALARSRSEIERDASLADRAESLAAIERISGLSREGVQDALVLDAVATFEIGKPASFR